MQKNEPGYSSLVGCELRTMTKRTHSARGRNNSRNVVTCNISADKKCLEVMPSKSHRYQAQKKDGYHLTVFYQNYFHAKSNLFQYILELNKLNILGYSWIFVASVDFWMNLDVRQNLTKHPK